MLEDGQSNILAVLLQQKWSERILVYTSFSRPKLSNDFYSRCI